ncbi:MAG: hypothetical protein IPP06_11400 [Saprospiraceae bacterium]|nr:hypothetical protein [Candidatus Vicinibacter affinis]
MKTYKTKIFQSIFFISSILLFSTITSCDKSEDNIVGTGTVTVEFDNRANGAALLLNKDYVNEKGETMNFSTFNYFVSNFSLVRNDGSIYVVPKDSCYFLIKEDGGSNPEISLNNIPAGDYKELRFIIGVDSLKSVSPASERVGALDPAGEAAGMYWAWNSGYIFVKAEGTSPQAPLDTNSNTRRFRYHIGLFGGVTSPTINNIKSISIHDHHGDVATVRSNISPNFHLKVDIMEMFKSPTTVSVAQYPTVMVNPYSATIANNFADMFTLDHIHN